MSPGRRGPGRFMFSCSWRELARAAGSGAAGAKVLGVFHPPLSSGLSVPSLLLSSSQNQGQVQQSQSLGLEEYQREQQFALLPGSDFGHSTARTRRGECASWNFENERCGEGMSG